jgi:hypothetical protein
VREMHAERWRVEFVLPQLSFVQLDPRRLRTHPSRLLTCDIRVHRENERIVTEITHPPNPAGILFRV